jgi:hypothetical protein
VGACTWSCEASPPNSSSSSGRSTASYSWVMSDCEGWGRWRGGVVGCVCVGGWYMRRGLGRSLPNQVPVPGAPNGRLTTDHKDVKNAPRFGSGQTGHERTYQAV